MARDKLLKKQVGIPGEEIKQLQLRGLDEEYIARKDCTAAEIPMSDIIARLRSEGFSNPTSHQVSMTARRLFIENQIGVDVDSRTALKLSEIPVPVLRERMNHINQLNKAGALLIGYRDLTKEDREEGIRIELVRPDILIPRTETIDANLDIYRRESMRYYGEGVPLNRSDGLVASTERLKANVTYLKDELAMDIRNAGDLLGESKKTLETSVAAIKAARPREELTIENLRTYVGRIKEK